MLGPLCKPREHGFTSVFQPVGPCGGAWRLGGWTAWRRTAYFSDMGFSVRVSGKVPDDVIPLRIRFFHSMLAPPCSYHAAYQPSGKAAQHPPMADHSLRHSQSCSPHLSQR